MNRINEKLKISIVIPNNISNKKELMKFYSKKLNLPDYFGENWDALYDLLCDLSWLECKTVIITHESTPNLDSENLKIYKQLLSDVREKWKLSNQKKIIYSFP